MKHLFTAMLILSISGAFSQNGVFTITEVYPSNPSTPLFYDSVFVTNPTGTVTTYSIPYISDIESHDSALNSIINGITSQGYGFVNVSPFVRIDFSTSSLENKTIVRWFLQELWTVSGLTQINKDALNIYPNPTNETINLAIDKKILNSLKKSELVIFSLNSIIVHKEQITDETYLYSINIEFLPAGSYFVTLKNEKKYTKPVKVIKL